MTDSYGNPEVDTDVVGVNVKDVDPSHEPFPTFEFQYVDQGLTHCVPQIDEC